MDKQFLLFGGLLLALAAFVNYTIATFGLHFFSQTFGWETSATVLLGTSIYFYSVEGLDSIKTKFLQEKVKDVKR